jgi:hypothetical protein
MKHRRHNIAGYRIVDISDTSFVRACDKIISLAKREPQYRAT